MRSSKVNHQMHCVHNPLLHRYTLTPIVWSIINSLQGVSLRECLCLYRAVPKHTEVSGRQTLEIVAVSWDGSSLCTRQGE